jgi:RsiW-degrading membrane proteinase PrsW (M82 family)
MVLSLFYLLIAFIPVLFYIGIIWATTPWKSIDIRTAFLYLLTGLMSIGIILTYFRLFPHCQDPLFLTDKSFSLLFFSFIQVALVEELCKLTAFSIGDRIRLEEREYDSPIGTMFYCGISALGFAFLENVNYALTYGGEVLIARSFIAMMVHFLCGLIIGYWVSVSRLPSKVETRSFFEVLVHKKPKLKRIVYYSIGVCCAMALHGLYDFNIFSGGGEATSYLIIFGGVVSAYLAAKNLMEKAKF